jgi:mannose-1-phosphate guanylyltransferase/mannose-6-phosphate isomerase
LFQQAAQRLANLGNAEIQVAAPLIVTGEDHRFLVAEQLREIGLDLGRALLEPFGRNTAPALTLAALAAIEAGKDPVLVVTPADQAVTDTDAFTLAIQQAIHEAATGTIVILGVPPTHPETGYGYIQVESLEYKTSRGDRNQNAKACICSVKRFVEKPTLETAQRYIQEGKYFWNAGIFILKASVWLRTLEKFRVDILKSSTIAWEKGIADGHFFRPDKDAFFAVPAESVDYSVIERCPDSAISIKMIPLNAGWSDLGSWDAVWNMLPKDENGNTQVGDVLQIDTHHTLVHATSRLVSLVGVSNLIVVETSDALLVADKSRSQDVKSIVAQLTQRKREEQALHRKVHRPWGWYDSIDEGGRFKVKRIRVKPKASLSLQKHHHRAEHWIVVSGTAEITNGDKVFYLTENQSTYIPLGEVHRLANPGTIPLEIVEVQSGSYLGEDDIVRYEDNYGRKK